MCSSVIAESDEILERTFVNNVVEWELFLVLSFCKC